MNSEIQLTYKEQSYIEKYIRPLRRKVNKSQNQIVESQKEFEYHKKLLKYHSDIIKYIGDFYEKLNHGDLELYKKLVLINQKEKRLEFSK